MENIRKWDICMTDLGSENVNGLGVQSRVRPCLVFQDTSTTSLTTIVIPLSSKKSHTYLKSHITVSEESGLLRESQVLCEQIRVIGKKKIGKKVAEIKDTGIMRKIEMAMMYTMGISFGELSCAKA